MVIGIFVILLVLVGIAIQNVNTDVNRITVSRDLAQQFAGNFRAYSEASVAFAENNQGYAGTISNQQLAPYLSPWAPPSGGVAEMTNGLLDVWAAPPGMTIPLQGANPQEEWVVREMLDTGGDFAYAVNVNGTLISPVGGNMGAVPQGCPNGSAVYQITAPHN